MNLLRASLTDTSLGCLLLQKAAPVSSKVPWWPWTDCAGARPGLDSNTIRILDAGH